MEKAVILFNSTNYAMWANDLLKEEKVDNKLVPVPRQFSSDCGYCVQINFRDSERAKDLLMSQEIEFDRIEKI